MPNPQIDKAIDDTLARAGFKVVPLDEAFKAKWEQARKDGNTVAAAGAWISEQQYGFKWGVRARTKAVILLGRLMYPLQYRSALARRAAWQHVLNEELKKVDFIALPTLQVTPLAIPWFGRSALLEARVLNLQNTVAVNFAGNPALAVPVHLNHDHFPVGSLQLIGPWFGEAELLNAGRLVEAETNKRRQ
jgi:amidase